MYSNSFYHPEYMQMDDERDENSSQNFMINGSQGEIIQDMGNSPRSFPIFEEDGQQSYDMDAVVHEDEEYDEFSDDYSHGHQSMETGIKETSGGRISNMQNYPDLDINQENHDLTANGRKMSKEDLDLNSKRNHGHAQRVIEFGSGNNSINGVQEQFCSIYSSDPYKMTNGAQEIHRNYGYTQQFPNETQYQPNGNQEQFQSTYSSQDTSMYPQNSFGSYESSMPMRHRTIFEKWQIEALEERFILSAYCCKADSMDLAEELDLSVEQVKNWFKNRKKKRTKELLKQNQLHHHNQMSYQSPPNSCAMKTSSSAPEYYPSYVSQMPTRYRPQNGDRSLYKNSPQIENWQVEVLEHKFAGKFSSTKRENEATAKELGLTVDQVKYFMRKKRELNKRNNQN